MSKKRFVEFYLAAMMKAATNNRVTRLLFTYTGNPEAERVRVEYEHDRGYGAEEFSVTGESLLGIAAAVLDHARKFLAIKGYEAG